MLVVPEHTVEYFKEVRKTAHDRGLTEQFDAAMMQAHLYGCGWEEPERCRFILFKDFAPLSFAFNVEFLEKDGSYAHFLNGGLIYQGPDIPADGSMPSLTVNISDPTKVGWFMHT